jgi:hypothetical protein
MERCVIDIETTSLIPTEGRIVCVGAMNAGTGEFRSFCDEDERKLVSYFLKYYKGNGFGEVIGYNVLFDIRYIFAKCLRYELPAREFLMSSYTDVMMTLKSVRNIYNFNKPGTLDEWASFVLGNGKLKLSDDVKTLYGQGRTDEIVRYNRQDVEVTRELWRRTRQVLENNIAGD